MSKRKPKRENPRRYRSRSRDHASDNSIYSERASFFTNRWWNDQCYGYATSSWSRSPGARQTDVQTDGRTGTTSWRERLLYGCGVRQGCCVRARLDGDDDDDDDRDVTATKPTAAAPPPPPPPPPDHCAGAHAPYCCILLCYYSFIRLMRTQAIWVCVRVLGVCVYIRVYLRTERS